MINSLKEIKALCELCKINPNNEMQYEFDWTQFLSIIFEHRITPIVFNYFSKSKNNIPVNIFNDLKIQYLQITLISMRHLAFLSKLQKYSEENSIRIIPFKGPTLSHHLYANLNLRHSVDLDVLVDFKHISSLSKYLQDNNFRTKFKVNKDELSKRKIFSQKKVLTYYSLENKIFIEVHEQIIMSSLLRSNTIDAFYQESEEIYLNGIRYNSLNNTDYFLYLLLHGTIHAWNRIGWLNDVYQFYSKYKTTIDWDKIYHQIHLNKLHVIISLVYSIMYELFLVKIIEFELFKGHKDTKKLLGFCYASIVRTSKRENLNIRTKINKYIYRLFLKPNLNYKISILSGLIARKIN